MLFVSIHVSLEKVLVRLSFVNSSCCVIFELKNCILGLKCDTGGFVSFCYKDNRNVFFLSND